MRIYLSIPFGSYLYLLNFHKNTYHKAIPLNPNELFYHPPLPFKFKVTEYKMFALPALQSLS